MVAHDGEVQGLAGQKARENAKALQIQFLDMKRLTEYSVQLLKDFLIQFQCLFSFSARSVVPGIP